ncbi:hypothetical protein CDO52_07285 [Nocardiopsis gilva YIM 90087]|uniref:Uncharacterized protein n=1 Tax=Nocardiopsis gilva YIM 90087 TaxID=1235441 RepID=A0A223S3B7_9ACTN|nr:hypothetical protein [Nocardiopsis gilva]ASU82615.1 hypothetical protein CDO52_07285 [Nocardiopsis gilva YIM 90087]
MATHDARVVLGHRVEERPLSRRAGDVETVLRRVLLNRLDIMQEQQHPRVRSALHPIPASEWGEPGRGHVVRDGARYTSSVARSRRALRRWQPAARLIAPHGWNTSRPANHSSDHGGVDQNMGCAGL